MIDNTDVSSLKGNEKYYGRKTVIRLFALVSALVCTVLFSISLARDFIPDKQIFEINANLFQITLYISLITSIVSLLLCAFLIPKTVSEESVLDELPKSREYYRTENVFVKLSRFLCAAILLAQGVVRCYLLVMGELLPHPPVIITVLGVALIFPLCIFFVPEIAAKTAPGYKNTHLVYGAIGVFWFVTMVIYFYFDKTVALSSPYKLMNQIMLISQLLAIVEEIRIHTVYPAPRARLGTLCAGFIITFGFTVGRIVMLVFGKMCNIEDTVSIFMGLAFALYFGANLLFYDEY